MFKFMAKRPIAKVENYLKYGFVITEHEYFICPRCKKSINAGPDYQPKCCDKCGQKINFSGVQWKEEKELGFAERGYTLEPLQD